MNCFLGICILAARLTSLDVTTNNNLPTVAHSYDGKARSIEQFYKSESPTYSASGDLYLNTNTKVSLGYHSGLDTKKLDVGSTKSIQVSQFKKFTDRLSVIFSAGIRDNGKIDHKPCIDTLNRKYYCGNLTAWSDFKPEEKSDVDYNVGIKLTYKF